MTKCMYLAHLKSWMHLSTNNSQGRNKVVNTSFVEKWKLNKVCLFIACVHWFITFFTDRLIFKYSLCNFSTMLDAAKSVIAFGCKVCFLAVLIILWHMLYAFFKKADKSFVKYTLIYLVLNVLLLLLTWPGI